MDSYPSSEKDQIPRVIIQMYLYIVHRLFSFHIINILIYLVYFCSKQVVVIGWH